MMTRHQMTMQCTSFSILTRVSACDRANSFSFYLVVCTALFLDLALSYHCLLEDPPRKYEHQHGEGNKNSKRQEHIAHGVGVVNAYCVEIASYCEVAYSVHQVGEWVEHGDGPHNRRERIYWV